MLLEKIDKPVLWIRTHHHQLKWLHSLWALMLGSSVMIFSRHDFRFMRLVIGYLFFIWAASLVLHWEAERLGVTEERRPKVRRVVLYIIQNFYHEMIFFLLPLYYASVTFSSRNLIFLLLLVVCALLASFDTVYWQWLTRNQWWTQLFYCFLLFACFHVFFPVFLGIRNSYSIYLAGIMAVLALITLTHRPDEWRTGHVAKRLGITVLCTLAGLYLLRGFIPPCPLELAQVTFSTGFQAKGLKPVHEIQNSGEIGTNRTLYVLVAVQAPLGIQEKVVLEWYGNGISMRQSRKVTMTGGRKEGFRIWDSLLVPDDPVLDYRVDVWTEGGQMIGRGRLYRP